MVKVAFSRSAPMRSGVMPQPARPSAQVFAWAAAKSGTDVPALVASPSFTHGWKSVGASAGKVRHRLVRSPLGSISRVGTPADSASSISTMPRPVLPDPVMPTITPCVVKSPLGSSTCLSVRAC